MNFILVFILPSVFGFKLIYENLDKKSKFNLFLYECMLLLISNLICTFLTLTVTKKDLNIVKYASSSAKFSLLYIVLLIFVGCIIGFIITIVVKYFRINIEVKHEKSSKRIKNSK